MKKNLISAEKMDCLPKMSLSISIFCKFPNINIDIFKNILIDIDISMNVFIDIDIDIDIFKSDLIDIDIGIDIFKTCRYIDNRYGLSIYRTPLHTPLTSISQMSTHDEAQRAIEEQEKLNRVGTEIYVNFRFFHCSVDLLGLISSSK